MNFTFKETISLVFIFFMFDIRRILADLIEESEFENLRDSLKHHLQNDKIIRKIPNDCSDRPHLELDLVFKEESSNGSIYYAVYANKQYYIRIEGITRDHLPIIRRSTQPMAVDTKFLRKMAGKNSINEYRFVGPLYLYRSEKDKTKYSIVGFNQVWIGCPQPMCLSPGFDGILSAFNYGNFHYHFQLYNSLIAIFRGNYFWYFEIGKNRPATHPPTTDMAMKIEDHWMDRRADNYRFNPKTRQYDRGYLNDSMVVPTYMDAVVPGLNRYNSCLYFFKNDEFTCYQLFSKLTPPSKIANEWKTSDNDWKSAKIDASFHINSFIYFISDDKIWCFNTDRTSCVSYPKNLKDLHKDFPTNITSAFQLDNTIYIIKGLLYYNFSASNFPLRIKDEEMVGKYLFTDLLGCDEGSYTAWGFAGYEDFIQKIAKRMQTELNHTEGQTKSNFNPTFLIISAITLVLSLSIFITIWYFRPIWITKVIQLLKSPFS